jgi:hypothetical protein
VAVSGAIAAIDKSGAADDSESGSEVSFTLVGVDFRGRLGGASRGVVRGGPPGSRRPGNTAPRTVTTVRWQKTFQEDALSTLYFGDHMAPFRPLSYNMCNKSEDMIKKAINKLLRG